MSERAAPLQTVVPMRLLLPALLFSAAAACSGPQARPVDVEASDAADSVAIDVLADVTATVADDTHVPAGLRVRAEVWPETLNPGAVGEGHPREVFVIGPDVPGPWPFVFSLSGPAPEIAAVALRRPDGGEPGVSEVRVCAFRGDVPLDRTSYSRVERSCTPLGYGRVDASATWTVFEAPEPFYAHYVWVFVEAPAPPFVLDEVRVLTEADLELVAEDPAVHRTPLVAELETAPDAAAPVGDPGAAPGDGGEVEQGSDPTDTPPDPDAPETVFDAVELQDTP